MKCCRCETYPSWRGLKSHRIHGTGIDVTYIFTVTKMAMNSQGEMAAKGKIFLVPMEHIWGIFFFNNLSISASRFRTKKDRKKMWGGSTPPTT